MFRHCMPPAPVLAGFLAILPVCTPVRAQATYTNPVIRADFADPTALRDADGTYWVYGTQGGHPQADIQVAHSTDLVHWTRLGDALPTKPAWASQTQNFWAPDVHRFGNTYFLYFAAQRNNDPASAATAPSSSAATATPPAKPAQPVQDMCLGVATSRTPAGPFIDSGAPLLCGTSFVDIDPMAFDDPGTGKHLLYWGSGFQAIHVQELADDRIHFKPGTVPTPVFQPVSGGGDTNYLRLVEGAWVTFHAGWYYLYVSGDNCCGEHAHYAVTVARSRSALGPFEMQPGSAAQGNTLLHSNGTWLAPGHNSTVLDGAGQEWIVYHAIDPAHRNDGRFLLMDRITYRDGWPTINDGSPTTGPTPAPKP